MNESDSSVLQVQKGRKGADFALGLPLWLIAPPVYFASLSDEEIDKTQSETRGSPSMWLVIGPITDWHTSG